MVIYCVRHGESQGNIKKGYISGSSDPEGLTQRGKGQVMHTAWELRHASIDEIYTSPVARARETAQIFTGYFDVPLHSLSWLSELNHGAFEGKYWWEVMHKIPKTWRARREDYRAAYPGGESMSDLMQRVSSGLTQWLTICDPEKTYLLVTHQAVIACIRYYFSHGSWETIQTPDAEGDFLRFLHDHHLENGRGITIVHTSDGTKEITEFSEPSPVIIDKKTVSWYVRGMFPQSCHQDVTHIETASENIVYQVGATSQSIVKILPQFQSEVMARQRKLYDYLHKKRIPAPHILAIDTTQSFFSAGVLIQDCAEGLTLKEFLHLRQEGVAALFDDVYRAFSRIHALPTHEVADMWIPPVEPQFLDWTAHMVANINKTICTLRDENIFDDDSQGVFFELSCLKDYIREGRYRLSPIHGDVGTGNIIVSDSEHPRVVRIIDFEWARVGDALWDYAYLWGWLERDEPPAAEAWRRIIMEKLPDVADQLRWFRILFHAWTVRDMLEYAGSPLRARRGKKSLKILRERLIP